MPAPIAGLVLAAGAGARLGVGPKALLSFRGRPLIEYILTQLDHGGCAGLTVVLGSQAPQVCEFAQLGAARTMLNPDWQSGLGSSFRCGVEASLADNPETAGLLVALADQPGITAAAVARLIGAHRTGRITAAGYLQGGSNVLRRGHPLIFDPELATAAAGTAFGDSGARAYLQANPSLIDVVDCSDLGHGRDVDTPADLSLLGVAAPKWQDQRKYS
ncbi:NTP transferase domain-containing protein [Arthrobacter sp. NPDC097144]|uniref:nucleotidyltransferase family protein n=1 Tax=Arthrobacter sp. NPDC097144 TaxID=3363946 RepID=UPI00382CFF32